MKQKFKFFFIVFVGLFFVIVGFYFWASSPNLSLADYNVSGQYEMDASPPEIDSVFSVLTYNIGYLSGMTNNLPVEKPKALFQQNLNKVIYELKKVNADILAFQEIDYDSNRSYHVDQQFELSKLGYPYYGKSINWDKKYVPYPYYPFSMHFGRILSGQSILSKFPILETERIELTRNENNFFYYDSFYLDRLAQVSKIKILNQTLVLINVHLEAFDKATRMLQMRQVKNTYIKYYRKFPTILLGDFNSDVHFTDAGIEMLLKISDTGCAAFDRDKPQNTFSSEEPTERLDYIFYNKEFIQEIDAKVLEEFDMSSDHLPLFMKFKFKQLSNADLRQQPDS
jgi:endonuclease/exonuclease/phosphatase family metal-dependent hydrolase